MNFRASNFVVASFLSASVALVACGFVASDPQPVGGATSTDPPLAVSLLQRTTCAVPGTDDRLVISIGDITRGRVFVTLVDRSTDTPLVARQPLYFGDTVSFRQDGDVRVLGLSRLENRLLGDDHAIFHIGTPEAVAEQQIRHLEDLLASARIQFVVAGADHDGKAAARAVRDAWVRFESKRVSGLLDARVRFEPKRVSSFLDALERTPLGDTSADSSDSAYSIRIGDRLTPISVWLRKRRAHPALLQPSRFASDATDR